MTEQYTPSDYDIHVQNPRIDQLESLITAEYEPPEGVEYSFPVANQGITQEQFRLMFLGQANGMIHGDNGTINDSPDSTGYRYYLEGHDSDSETNQRNTLFLRAGTSAESIVEGFYHRLTEDMELPFPAVTTTTVYHVTITYDPRDFKTSPLKIQVYPGEPPTSQGRIHVLLHTVERRPNQLLSQAKITRYRQYTAGLLSVQNEGQLPDPASVPAGTLAVPSASGAGVFVRANTSLSWENLLYSEWRNLNVNTGNQWYPRSSDTTPQVRRLAGGRFEIRGQVTNTTSMTGMNASIASLPEGWRPSRTFDFECVTVPSGNYGRVRIRSNGVIELGYQSDTYYTMLSLDGITYSID